MKVALWFSDSELQGTSYNFWMLRKEHFLSTSYVTISTDRYLF